MRIAQSTGQDELEREAVSYFYGEDLHRLCRLPFQYPFFSWLEDSCESEGMTVSEFAQSCVESLRIQREDTGVTCPLCGAGFGFGTQQGIDASQVHICGVTA